MRDRPELWTEAEDWSSLGLETTLPLGHPTRLGRIVPSDREGALNGRRVNFADLLTVDEAVELGVIATDDEVVHWRLQLHNERARTLRRYRYVSAAEMRRRKVERQLAAGRNA